MTNQGQTPANRTPGTDPADHIEILYEGKRVEARHLVPLAEAADFLGVSRWTVRRMIAAEKLTGYWVGDQLRVHKQELATSVRKVKPSEVMTPADRRRKQFEDSWDAHAQDKAAK
jgi:excisionase family DNA binding protein